MTPTIDVPKEQFLRELGEVFFLAMLDGYTQKDGAMDTVDHGTYKEESNEFCRGPWRVVDKWITVNHGPYGSGQTIIFWNDVPVWIMSYGGYYPKGVIPILKAALRENYEARIFHGGRGPRSFQDPRYGDWVYESNVWDNLGVSSNPGIVAFAGREFIFPARKLAPSVGFHQFQGHILVELE